MKTKYMSRKFIISLAGLGVSIYALHVNNTSVAIAGLILAGCFVIGESIVDKHSVVHREQKIVINDHKYVNKEDKETE